MEIREIDKNIGKPVLVIFNGGSPRPTAIRITRRVRSMIYAQYNINGKIGTGVWMRRDVTMVKGNHSTAELRETFDALYPTYTETRPEYMPHAKCDDADCGKAKHDHYPAWMR
jgi:hypothetical protein